MEADDSAINVPAIAAAHVIKRYVAQAPDEISLEVLFFIANWNTSESKEYYLRPGQVMQLCTC